jgi:hypothetical protein
MRRLLTVLALVAALAGGVVGGRTWIAQDRARCALVADFLQPVLCRPEVVESLAFQKGRFEGTLDVRFMSMKTGDGQTYEMVQLLTPFAYRDSKGVLWEVPAGFMSDGASIPAKLWAVVGGPYSGPYRDASVIHDFYCYTKSRPWTAVHEVFLEAALNRGTPDWQARYMYAGILFQGPRWPDPQVTDAPSATPMLTRLAEWLIPSARAQTPPGAPPPAAGGLTDAQIFEELRTWIEKDKPTLEQIRKRVEELRQARTPVKK